LTAISKEKTTSKADEITITIVGARPFSRIVFDKYAPYMFQIIKSREITRYPLARAERNKAYNELCKVLVCPDLVNQVLEYHFHCEKEGFVFPEAESNPLFLKAIETLRGRKTAPLITELDTRTAFTLWSKAGSWTGAMQLAGLDLLTDKDEIIKAIKHYAIQQASVDILPHEIKKNLSSECLDAINKVCNRARKYQRLPTNKDLKTTKPFFYHSAYTYKMVFAELGLYDPTMKITQQQRRQDGIYWFQTSNMNEELIGTNKRQSITKANAQTEV
jgi:hypothetical protein